MHIHLIGGLLALAAIYWLWGVPDARREQARDAELARKAERKREAERERTPRAYRS
jgi:hypothetical protein